MHVCTCENAVRACALRRLSTRLVRHPIRPSGLPTPAPNLLICTHAICRALAMMALACERARGAGVVVVLIPASAHISDLLKPITGFWFLGRAESSPSAHFTARACVIDFRPTPKTRRACCLNLGSVYFRCTRAWRSWQLVSRYNAKRVCCDDCCSRIDVRFCGCFDKCACVCTRETLLIPINACARACATKFDREKLFLTRTQKKSLQTRRSTNKKKSLSSQATCKSVIMRA